MSDYPLGFWQPELATRDPEAPLYNVFVYPPYAWRDPETGDPLAAPVVGAEIAIYLKISNAMTESQLSEFARWMESLVVPRYPSKPQETRGEND